MFCTGNFFTNTITQDKNSWNASAEIPMMMNSPNIDILNIVYNTSNLGK